MCLSQPDHVACLVLSPQHLPGAVIQVSSVVHVRAVCRGCVQGQVLTVAEGFLLAPLCFGWGTGDARSVGSAASTASFDDQRSCFPAFAMPKWHCAFTVCYLVPWPICVPTDKTDVRLSTLSTDMNSNMTSMHRGQPSSS